MEQHRSTTTVSPAVGVDGSVRLPGDKSVSHRYAMLAALANGTTKLMNFATAADCASTVRCVEHLGCSVKREGTTVEITGRSGNLAAPSEPLDCGNSGSTMRMMAGVLAGQNFHSEMLGDESLSKRPMQRIIEPLRQMGAEIRGNDTGRPPIVIDGRRLKAIRYATPVASAQVKSCVLLAGLSAEGETTVVEPVLTRDHTEVALRAFGAEVQTDRSQKSVTIRGGQSLNAIEAFVPGDLSTATFFLAAVGLFPGTQLIFDNVLLNPSRSAVLDVFSQMGVNIGFLRVDDHNGEVVGTIQARGNELRGYKISGELTAALIDELPALAAIAPFTRDGIEIRDARELRIKETDRIAAVAENLRRMGAKVEEFEDGLIVPGGQTIIGGEVDSYGDHRIAMAFAIAALRGQRETKIHGAEAVAVSFPEFWATLSSVVQR